MIALKRALPLTVSPLFVLMLLAGCSREPDTSASKIAEDAPPSATDASQAGTPTDEIGSDVPAFPIVPNIVVPEIIGVTPAQRALESSMQTILDPVRGVTVSPARCSSEGALINDGGITRVDEHGQLMRNGDEGLFVINADGSGTANFEGGLVHVNADGSGTINGSAGGSGDGEEAIIRVEADGSGTYNGPAGLIRLDGKGAGTWNGESGLITNNGDGSGTWNGPEGLLQINADGSGTWNGDAGLITNHGDGTGTIGPPARPVKMPPMPRLQPAGKFPPLKKFAPPGAPCGYLITLNDQVLFDFDKSDIRPDAAQLLDTLSDALKQVEAKGMEIRGHTDSKGDDAYNQALSERRAAAVVAALRQRGAAQDAAAKGYGESEPVAPNVLGQKDNPAGRQMNRRVEIFVRA